MPGEPESKRPELLELLGGAGEVKKFAWRARDRGDLTQQEYLNALAATQGTVAPLISHTQRECENMSAQDSQRESTESLPKLMSALEVLQLRRSFGYGQNQNPRISGTSARTCRARAAKYLIP
jgi:hypothetical protein